ncbi:MAG: hypothetical protein ACRBI6_14650 [Acidimicrobiales bacterium]
MAKGKWAQGITPRRFQWVIGDKLAVCERPGGYGPNHRRVRRQEEIIWLRENGFAFVISLIPSDHNLHSYDELGLPWKHWPFAPHHDTGDALAKIYPALDSLLSQDIKVVLHGEEVGDRLAGLLAGYLLWSGKVEESPKAIVIIEQILSRQLGPEARQIVAAAAALGDEPLADGDAPNDSAARASTSDA